jgi:uncharacterized coiled-coil DUF342 family protein
MNYVLIEQFKLARTSVNEVLAKMFINLEQYAQKPNASQTVVQIQNRQFDEIENYLRTVDALFQEFDKVRAENEILKRKITNYEAKHKSNGFETGPSKEFLREQSINNAQHKWPKLY